MPIDAILMSAPFPFEPVRARSTVQDVVYRALNDALVVGRFEPGQVLTLDALSKSFGTSHMPVREALRRLAAEGALELTAGGSCRVPTVSRERLDHIFDARYALETLAVERAVPFVTGDVLRNVKQACAAHQAITGDDGVEALLRCNREFHFLIYGASGSEVLTQLIGLLWLRFGPYLRMLSRALGTRIGTAEFDNGAIHHLELVAALENQDIPAAVAAIRGDTGATYQMLVDLIESDAA
ncbi:MAG: GntR family transcriptional regulator [Pseudomonadota bacterium]